MWRTFSFVLIVLLPLASWAPPLAADQIVMRRDNFGADLAFIDGFLKRSWTYEYRPEEPLGDYPELTLDRVDVGRYDVNGDGEAELFVHVGFVVACGTVGCPVYFFERENGDWVEVDDVSGMMGGPSMDIWSDPVTGYTNVLSYFAGFRWTGEDYEYLGDKEVVEVSARMPPDFEAEDGCFEPRGTDFTYLEKYVGTRKYLCLIYDPKVKPALDALLGPEFLHLRMNMDRRTPIDYSEGHLTIVSTRRPVVEGGDETSIVMVSTFDGRVHVGIRSKGVRTIYSLDAQWSWLPRLMRVWARGGLEFDDLRPPEGVVWIGRAEE